MSPLISAVMSQSMRRRLSGSGEGSRRRVLPSYQPVSRTTGMQPFVDWTPQASQTSADPYTRGLQEALPDKRAETARVAELVMKRLAAKKAEEEEATGAEAARRHAMGSDYYFEAGA